MNRFKHVDSKEMKHELITYLQSGLFDKGIRMNGFHCNLLIITCSLSIYTIKQSRFGIILLHDSIEQVSASAII